MTYLRSNYPTTIDKLKTLPIYQDMTIEDKRMVGRYQVLVEKNNLTPDEQVELSSLVERLRDKMINSEDWNQLIGAVLNLETYFKDNVLDHIDNKLSGLNTIAANTVNTVEKAKNDAIANMDSVKTETINSLNRIGAETTSEIENTKDGAISEISIIKNEATQSITTSLNQANDVFTEMKRIEGDFKTDLPILNDCVERIEQADEQIKRLQDASNSVQDDIAKIESVGNKEILIRTSEWTLNGDVYEKEITHDLCSENLHVTAKNSDTKEAVTIGYKILDKTRILLKSDDPINMSIILSASYYHATQTISDNIAEEVVKARKGEADLKTKIDSIDEQLDKNIQELNFLKERHLKVNVKDFGAKGDGITDDSQSFQKAVNKIFELCKTGGIIEVPRGKYLINTPFSTSIAFYSNFLCEETSDLSCVNANGRNVRITINGDSRENTLLIAGDKYIIRQNLSGEYWYDLEINDIAFVSKNIMDGSTPIYFNKSEGIPRNVTINRCSSNNFDIGIEYDRIKTSGSLSEQMRLTMCDVIVGGNNIGFYLSGDDTSLIACRSERNNNSGVVIAGGNRVSLNKCKIQYNCRNITDVSKIHQIKLKGSVVSLNFYDCYFEQKSSSLDNNYNTTWILVEKYSDTKPTYLYNFNIKDCYINGIGCKTLIKDDGNGNAYKGLRIEGNRIRNFYLENNTLIDIPNTSSINDIYFNNTVEEIYDLASKTSININDILICPNNSLKENNSRCHLSQNVSPSVNAMGGQVINIFGCFNGAATQKYHGGEWFNVVKEATGIYTITLLHFTNVSSAGGNNVYFPVVATANQSGRGYCCVEHTGTNTFKIYTYSQANVLVDTVTGFITSILVN